MGRVATFFAISLLFMQTALFGEAVSSEEAEETVSQESFQSFTGKLTRDRVRMRLHPSLDSPVVREMDSGDMVVVTGEEDVFYAVQSPSELKGYVYRTFVLDGIIEGNRVNVRLDPHLEAPVIAQLNQGDSVEGSLCPANNKWLEIPIPSWIRFYVASDYVEKIGDPSFLALHEKRKAEVKHLLDETDSLSQSELKKPLGSMEVDGVVHNYKKVIEDYKDFPDCVKQAKQRLVEFQEAYLEKKVAYLEAKTHADETLAAQNNRPAKAINVTQETPLVSSESHQENGVIKPHQTSEDEMRGNFEIDSRMAQWLPIELSFYEQWANNNDNPTIQRFYEEQRHQSIDLTGIVEPYDRPVRNKPGDYILVDRKSRLPMAYLYSTQVNLQDKIGQEIAVVGVQRPNHYFAYPAYFVLSAE